MKGIIFLLLAFALVIMQANSLSFVSDSLTNNTMELIDGTSRLYGIRLQNPSDNEIGVKLDYDTEFMKVIDYKDVYVLQPKETGYGILFNVTAPKKTGSYTLGYTVSEVEPGGGSGLALRVKINRSFTLKIIENPKKIHINYLLVAYVILLIIAMIAIVRKAMGNRKVNK